MEIVLWCVIGIIAGSGARLLMSGPRAGGLAAAIPLGIVGALLGGFLSLMLDDRALATYDILSALAAVLGALVVMLSYRSYALRLSG
jgi:uncharacterized membrane protein YeaQ/YmgE (transglycosylase-associated protein family)